MVQARFYIGVTTVSGDVTVFVREISDDDELVDGVVPVPELLPTCDTSGALVPINCVKAVPYDYRSLGSSTNRNRHPGNLGFDLLYDRCVRWWQFFL